MNKRIISLFILTILLMSGCDSVDLLSPRTSIDQSTTLKNGSIKTFNVQPNTDIVISRTKMRSSPSGNTSAGKTKYSEDRGDVFEQAIEVTIIKRFESIGMIYDPDNYDLNIVYNPGFFSNSSKFGTSKTTGWMRIVGINSKNHERLFDTYASYESQATISIIVLKEVTDKVVSQLEIFKELEKE